MTNSNVGNHSWPWRTLGTSVERGAEFTEPGLKYAMIPSLFSIPGANAMKRFFSYALLLLAVLALPTQAKPLEFTLTDLEGETIRAEDYRGQWLLVNFWATWCPPCREELPDLGNMHEQREDFAVLGINQERLNRAKLTKFIDEYMIPYPVIPRSVQTAQIFGRVRGLPTSILVNPQGEAVKVFQGPVTEELLDRAIRYFGRAKDQIPVASQ